MDGDDVLEEVRRVRVEHAARFNYDLRAIVEDLRRREGLSGHPLVLLGPVDRTMEATRAAMIELTDQQVQELGGVGEAPPRLVNPRTNETFVLLRLDEYERLTADDYDDGPWTAAELNAQAREVAERSGWEGLDEPDVADRT